MITGAFIFAYVVGSVCNIATSLSASTNEYVPVAAAVSLSAVQGLGALEWQCGGGGGPGAMHVKTRTQRSVWCTGRFRNTMDSLNRFMDQYRTPPEVQHRLRAYVIYCRYSLYWYFDS